MFPPTLNFELQIFYWITPSKNNEIWETIAEKMNVPKKTAKLTITIFQESFLRIGISFPNANPAYANVGVPSAANWIIFVFSTIHSFPGKIGEDIITPIIPNQSTGDNFLQ